MSGIKSGRMKELQPCACGCGKKSHWHELRPLRCKQPQRGGGQHQQTHFVLDECRGAYADELEQWRKIHQLHKALAGTFFWQRWRAAKAWYILQFTLRARLLGPDRAAQIARRDTLLLMAPRWLAAWFVKRNPGRNPQRDSKGANAR